MFYIFLNKFINRDYSNGIVAVFILILPFILNVNVSDMFLSIRYLALNILILLVFMLSYKKGIIIEVFKNPNSNT